MNDTQPGIALPSAFSPTTPTSLRAYVGACLDFLTSPLVTSLLECHPNDIAVDGPRPEWLPWWGWAARDQAVWRHLVPGWPRDDDGIHTPVEVPLQLAQLLDIVDTLTIPRAPSSTSTSHALPPMRGMSRKKSHEVSEMSAFIGSLLSRSSSEIKHVVDVGAGQGYLSRVLSEHPYSLNVLALDFSEIQTTGAERRGRNIKKKSAKSKTKVNAEDDTVKSSADLHTTISEAAVGNVTHEMIHINPQTLEVSVTNWISTASSSSQDPAPIFLVALHACGSLTPDIIRCFVTCRGHMSSPEQPRKNWYPAGLVVVGCCYNLMSPESDFPMSTIVLNETKRDKGRLVLSYNHRSLAAQTPSQWTLDNSTTSAAALAIRKVVYRALLEKQATLHSDKIAASNSKENPMRHGKVGRLHDSAYTSLQVFITQFNTRNESEVPIPAWDDVQDLASCLEVLHVLRCRIGPVVESLILVDRWLHLTESLPADDVFSVNLFDQGRGSARNVALVVRPRYS